MSIEGWNTTLQMAPETEGAAGTYGAVLEVTDVSGGGIDTATVEDTPLGQQWSRFKALGSSQSPITFTVNYSTADHATLVTLAKNPVMKWWKVTFAEGGGIYETAGLLSNFTPGPANRADRLTASFTIRTSGEPVIS